MEKKIFLSLGVIVLIGLYLGYNKYITTKEKEIMNELVFSNIEALTENNDEPSADGKYVNYPGLVYCVYTINYVDYPGVLIECRTDPAGGPCAKGCIKSN